jgi:hypothetical protein
MLARTPASVRKKRAYRRRQRDGAIVIRCEICEHDFAQALLTSRRLDERQALRRDELARAAEQILHEWCQRWLDHNQ